MNKSSIIALLGSCIACGGLYKLVGTFQTTGLAFRWGMVAVVGLFLLAIGVGMSMGDGDHGSASVEAEKAVTKTDSRF